MWEPVGDPIRWMGSGQAIFEDNVLSMSHDGKVVAIGQTQDKTADNFSGRVSIFKGNDFFGWLPLGGDINRRIEQDAAAFGFSVSLNDDGKAIAIGDPGDTLGRAKGKAFIYKCEGNEWNIKGNVISPADEGENDIYAGKSVSLSADGNTVAVMMQIKSRIPGESLCFVRVFRTYCLP